MMMSLLVAVVDCNCKRDCVDSPCFVVSFSSAQLRFDGVEDEEAAADDVGGPVDVFAGLIRGVPRGAWLPDSADPPTLTRFSYHCSWMSAVRPLRIDSIFLVENRIWTGPSARNLRVPERRQNRSEWPDFWLKWTTRPSSR